jgi:hypothetical protein
MGAKQDDPCCFGLVRLGGDVESIKSDVYGNGKEGLMKRMIFVEDYIKGQIAQKRLLVALLGSSLLGLVVSIIGLIK